MPRSGGDKGAGVERRNRRSVEVEESTVKQRVRQRKRRLQTAGVSEERGCACVRREERDREEDEGGVRIQLLRSSSVAVSTSQDFDDNATITAFFSKPMAQSLSILRVYSGLETGAPA